MYPWKMTDFHLIHGAVETLLIRYIAWTMARVLFSPRTPFPKTFSSLPVVPLPACLSCFVSKSSKHLSITF